MAARKQYKLVVGDASSLGKEVTQLLAKGWELYGTAFRTGNMIRAGGDPAYPGTCTYTAEVAQPMVKEDVKKS